MFNQLKPKIMLVINIVFSLILVVLALYLFCGVAKTLYRDIKDHKKRKLLKKEEEYHSDLEAASQGKLIAKK